MKFSASHLAWLLCAPLIGLCAQTQDNELTRFEASAPVRDFSLPMFGDGGFKTWDLSGKQGRYQSQERIDIEGARLRLFSGDESARVEVTIESPQALVNPKLGLAQGADFLYVHGPGYSVTGRDWVWNEREKTLTIKKDVQVTFASEKEDGTPITVMSRRLSISTQPDQYYFRFEGAVKVINGPTEMQTPSLEAWSWRADNLADASASRLRGVRRILADKGVTVSQQGGRTLTAQRAEMPESGGGSEIVLTGSPEMRDSQNDAVLTGGEVRLWRDRQKVLVFPKEGGRVRASLPPMEKDAPGRMDITSERLELEPRPDGGRSLSFFDKVEVADPGSKVWCDRLTADISPGSGDGLSLEAGKKGALELITAHGNVIVDQSSRRTRAKEGRIDPEKGEATLTGDPMVVDNLNGAILEGDRIILVKAGAKALVFGAPGKQAHVTLAPMQQTVGGNFTHIYSDSLQMTRGQDVSVVSFLDNVKVESGDMRMTCGGLDVFVAQENAPKKDAASPEGLGKIARIEAREQVRYSQQDMRGHAARIEIFPSAIVKNDDDSQPGTPQRFMSLFGDPSGKQGPVRPEVFLPPVDAALGASSTAEKTKGETRLVSDEQEMFTRPDGSHFFFKGDVELTGDDVRMTCDRLAVECLPSPENAGDPAGRLGNPEKVSAIGNVAITQGTRSAKGGFAEMSLRTGKCVLGDNPVVTDSADGSRVEGYRITLLRGQDRVFVEGTPPADTAAAQTAHPRKRPTVILPQFNMNMDRAYQSKDKSN